MKKSIALVVFSLLTISLFAVPSSDFDAGFIAKTFGVFIHAVLLLILSLFIMLNVPSPKKERTKIMTILLAIFAITFALLFFSPDVLIYDFVNLFFILLDIFFLSVAFYRIKKHQNFSK